MKTKQKKLLLLPRLRVAFSFLQPYLGKRYFFPIDWKLLPRSIMGYFVFLLKEFALLFVIFLIGKKNKIVMISGKFLNSGGGGDILIKRNFSLKDILGHLKNRELFHVLVSETSDLHLFSQLLHLGQLSSLSGLATQQGIIIFDAQKNILPCIVKLAFERDSMAVLRKQKTSLEVCSNINYITTPELIDFREDSEFSFLQQKFVCGNNVEIIKLSDDEFRDVISISLKFLDSFNLRVSSTAAHIASDLIDLPEFVVSASVTLNKALNINPALAIFTDWAKNTNLGSVPVHGDYQLNNILFENGNAQVSGLIDWDRYEENGFLLQDALHLVVCAFAIRTNQHRMDILCQLIFDKNTNLEFVRIIYGYAESQNIDEKHIPFLALQLWLKYLYYAFSEKMTFSEKWMLNFTAPVTSQIHKLEEQLKNIKNENTAK